MKTLSTFLMVLAMSSAVTFAESGGGGNGGNVGVCFPKKDANNDGINDYLKIIKDNNNRIPNDIVAYITSVTPLDLYEARARFDDLKPDQYLHLPQEGEDPDAYATRMIERLDYIPYIVDILKGKLAALKENRTYYRAGGIDRIYDTNEAYYLDPASCVIATAIAQAKNNGVVTLEFDKRLYGLDGNGVSSSVTKGVLILHETVLRWALDLGQKDAKNARGLVSVLLQKDLSRNELIKKLKQFGFISPEKSYYIISDGQGSRNAFGKGSYSSEFLFVAGLFKKLVYFSIIDILPDGFLRDVQKYSPLGDSIQGVIKAKYKMDLGSINCAERTYNSMQGMNVSWGKWSQTDIRNRINELNRNIPHLEAEIKEIQRKIARAILGARKLERKLKETQGALANSKQELQTLTSWDSAISTCESDWKKFVAKYNPEVDEMLKEYKNLVHKNEQVLLRDIESHWMNEEYKKRSIEQITKCTDEVMGDLDFKKCYALDDSNLSWNIDLTVP